MAQNYDPRRSNVKEEALAEFIRAPITGDLTEVSRWVCACVAWGGGVRKKKGTRRRGQEGWASFPFGRSVQRRAQAVYPHDSRTHMHTRTNKTQQVPGIGPKAAEALASGDDPNERITNTFQLIGK